MKLLLRFYTILTSLVSGYKINSGAFDTYAEETARLYVKLYGWYRMPPSVHKILIHGSKFVQNFSIPIGELSEEAQEATNKVYRRVRQDNSRKNSRINTIEDVFHMLLVCSDPVISSLRLDIKTNQKKLS